MMKSLKEIRFKEFIFNNFALKILAVVIAIILWIIVVNIDDPSQKKPISGITVELLNEADLAEKGYTYNVESGSVISIVVKGPQSIVEQLKPADFYAYADLSERSPESDAARIVVTCTNDSVASKIDIVSQQSDYLKLTIDNKVSEDFTIDVGYTGKPADGYVVGDVSASPTSIKVTGAEATVMKIKSAKITYDISDYTASVNTTVSPVFYDEDGNVVSADLLELSRDSVQIYIEVLPTKWIPVNFAVGGIPADGYSLTDTVADIEKVQVAGTKDELAAIEAIDIPGGVIDISGATENKDFTIALSTYIAANYTIVSQSTMTVTATIDKVSDAIVNIPFTDITVGGLSASYDIAYDEKDGKVLEVGISGVEAAISKLTSDDLDASISLSGKGIGTYTVKVNFTANSAYKITGSYYVNVIISSKDSSETTTAEETTTAVENK